MGGSVARGEEGVPDAVGAPLKILGASVGACRHGASGAIGLRGNESRYGRVRRPASSSLRDAATALPYDGLKRRR